MLTYQKYFKEIKEGVLAPVYLLFGEEDYIIDELLRAITGRVLDERASDFSCDYLDGEEAGLDEVSAAVETLPFSCSRRLVVVRNAPYFSAGNRKTRSKKADRDKLLSLLMGIPATTCLVFTAKGEVDQRQKSVQQIKNKGRLWECPFLKGNALSQWISSQVKKKGAKIENNTAVYLSSSWTYGMYRLEHELDKLVAYAGEGGMIEREHIELLTESGTTENIFRFLDAVGTCQTQKALSLLEQMLVNGEPPLLLLFHLTQRVRIMGAVKAIAQEGLPLHAIASRLKQRTFVINKALEQAKNFSFPALEICLEACLWADQQLKRGLLEPRLVIELLIVKITDKSLLVDIVS